MSRLQFRGLIVLAAVVVVLLSSRPAGAQIGFDPGPPREPGGLCNNLITGVQYDIVNKAKAERRLQYLEGKIRRDSEQCDSAAVDRDARRIDNVRYRIAMDEWLIRWNSLENPGFYPIRTNAFSCAAIAQAGHPIPSHYPQVARLSQDPYPSAVPTMGPMSAAPTIPITIVNAEPAGPSVTFVIDGVSHEAAGSSRQELAVAPGSIITYDGGGSLGQRRYSISSGAYEFRSTTEGRALYKLAEMPRK